MDTNRLTRNYEEQPLKRGEQVPLQDVVYLYIELNWCGEQITKYFNRTGNWGNRLVKSYNLVKSKEMKAQSLRNYYMETLGVENPAQLKSTQDKMKKTMLEKYGVENIAHKKETVDKRRKTCLEKYGKDNPAKVKEFQDKMKQTNLRLYGTEYAQSSEEIKQKQQNTMLEKYGCKVPLQNENIKRKQEETCLQRYGVKNAFQNKEVQEKMKQTLRELYGVANAMKSEYIKSILEQTCMERYGCKNILQVPEFHKKQKNTMIQKYGAPNASQVPELQQKKYDTMNENDTWPWKSKPEKEIKEMLEKKFNKVEYQYNKDPRYPFLCDFYIVDIDTFIEFQGFISHGGHPYNPFSKRDRDKENKWLNCAIKHYEQTGELDSSYFSYIETWTNRDPMKRQIAKDNNLNYIEFFTLKQFMNWYSKL